MEKRMGMYRRIILCMILMILIQLGYSLTAVSKSGVNFGGGSICDNMEGKLPTFDDDAGNDFGPTGSKIIFGNSESGIKDCIKFSWTQSSGGWVNTMINFDFSNISEYSALQFYIKGDGGDEDARITLNENSSRNWYTALKYFSEVGTVTTDWQKMVIPLSVFDFTSNSKNPSLTTETINAMHFGAREQEGSTLFYIDNIVFVPKDVTNTNNPSFILSSRFKYPYNDWHEIFDVRGRIIRFSLNPLML